MTIDTDFCIYISIHLNTSPLFKLLTTYFIYIYRTYIHYKYTSCVAVMEKYHYAGLTESEPSVLFTQIF